MKFLISYLSIEFSKKEAYIFFFKYGALMFAALLSSKAAVGPFFHEKMVSYQEAIYSIEIKTDKDFKDIVCSEVLSKEIELSCLSTKFKFKQLKRDFRIFKNSEGLLISLVSLFFPLGLLSFIMVVNQHKNA
jgi:hypothetical protein